ncbi:uncharacterized protein MONBRDRAFT_37054 [Monosiga brevicollis MX1]|uniref:Endonuclease/exonuclease/phosphatase domain-containing protein n=1 Tax=Monosiga brevicollis TaxID=81824 RepID=A9UZB8_MONBE|nr:uncharacterized protein MONBRDRAFT_37054 [Monosiga brevicollis MX1]EDQ89205.1 predicted protein [Monosiga brevicollis MX1]|eukprot:XP_001745781.1 hypothetical protein [Monosiga brevicollis MX1]
MACQPLHLISWNVAAHRKFSLHRSCLMFCAGTTQLALFNVYVPNDGAGSSRLPYKMKFLTALRECMGKAKAEGYFVVLVGDLNIARRAEARLQQAWPTLHAAIEARSVEPIEVSFKGTGRQTKYRLILRSVAGKKVIIGSTHTDEQRARHSVSLEARHVTDPDDATRILRVHDGGELHVEQLIDIWEKVLGIELAEMERRALATIANRVTSPPCGRWIDDLLSVPSSVPQNPLAMLDSFTTLHPTAQARFTCWDQYKNRRYENRGSRIDYVLLDQDLAGLLVGSIAPPPAPPGSGEPNDRPSLVTTAAADCANAPQLVANGWCRNPHCERCAQAATTSQYRDHIGVSALLKVVVQTTLEQQEARTRAAQPFKSQTRISSFFSKSGEGVASVAPLIKPKISAAAKSPSNLELPPSQASSPSTVPDSEHRPSPKRRKSASSGASRKGRANSVSGSSRSKGSLKPVATKHRISTFFQSASSTKS